MFEGVYPPIPTPFVDGQVAHDKLAENLARWNQSASLVSRQLWIFWATMVVSLVLLSHLQAQTKSKKSGVF